ncbi:ATP pyrophosphatase [Desulfurella sp.]|uniref:PAB0415 family putative ATP pyrophosphatase n=1 Tax=Desulfurella sp. TaxID=1962857 RepID=UPI003D09A4E7
MKAASFFSGGKDGLFATYLAQKNDIYVKYFLLLNTTIGLSVHYENLNTLKLLAESCKKELLIFDMKNGQEQFVEFLKVLDVDMVISGDIDLESHYDWLKELAKRSNKEFLEPLWKQDSKILVKKMLDCGFKYSIIACDKSKLDKKYLGYTFVTEDDLHRFLIENPHIDPAGEAGEFHTIVTSCPLYDRSFKLRTDFVKDSEKYYYLQCSLE